MQPFTDLQKHIAGIQAQVRKTHEQNLAVMRAIQGQARFASAVARLNLGSLRAAAVQLAGQVQRAQALDEAGWLPHVSTPLARVEECGGDSEAIHTVLSAFYEEHWLDVRQGIESRLIAWQIDEEAKETFREALTAHEAGLYRSVCRLLFPEIERVVRKELHDDSMDRITNQKALREVAARLPVSVMEPGGILGMKLVDRFSNHVYEDTPDEEARQRLAGDPVPNRHAVVHGLVVYATMQNSLNTIFIADYVLQLVSVLKELHRSTRMNGPQSRAAVCRNEGGGSAASTAKREDGTS